jgi:tetratricopeptide (TPR) repeat protein
MMLRHSLAEKVFVICSIAVTGLQAAMAQSNVNAILARAEVAYYEARFNDTIAMLEPLNTSLENQPARRPELVRTKMQLALAHIGLNQLNEAKALFLELVELDSQFSLDKTKFAPKVLALFEEAKAASVPPKNSGAADSIYAEAVQAYNRGNVPEALEKIHSVLALNPQHPLATEYLALIDNRLRLSIEQRRLDWNTQFRAGDYVHAAESYRQLLQTNFDERAAAALDQVRSEYRKAVAELRQSWTQACAVQDKPTMEGLRKKANEVLPETSIALDLLEQMENCADTPNITDNIQPADSVKLEPEPLEGCLENPSSTALVRLKHRVEPRLPVEARRKRNIRVQVNVKIDEAGNTRVYQVHGGSMPVTRAVVTAVDQWKFFPATYNDRPACVETEFPLVLNP